MRKILWILSDSFTYMGFILVQWQWFRLVTGTILPWQYARWFFVYFTCFLLVGYSRFVLTGSGRFWRIFVVRSGKPRIYWVLWINIPVGRRFRRVWSIPFGSILSFITRSSWTTSTKRKIRFTVYYLSLWKMIYLLNPTKYFFLYTILFSFLFF